jgi:hypothetical protein
VIGMVRHPEPRAHELDDPSTGPEPGRVSRGLRAPQDSLHQGLSLAAGQFGRPTGCGPSRDPGLTATPIGPLPAADGAAIHAQPIRHHMHGHVLLEEFNGASSPLFQVSRAPGWAHVVPPIGSLGH